MTPSVDAGSGSTPVPASATLSGLTPNQTYYVALVATNSSGTTDGATQLFTTTVLSFATTGQASSPGATTATLTGSVNPGGSDTTYHFEYGTSSTALGSTTASFDAGAAASGSVPVSVVVRGLRPDKTYYFELVATNASGTAFGALALFATTPLQLATTGQASALTATGATLGGMVTPGGTATSYHFEYGTSVTNLALHTATLNAGSAATGSVPVSATITGLVPDQAYYFALVATNTSGTTVATPASFATTSLQLATTGQASAVTATGATLGGWSRRAGPRRVTTSSTGRR